MKIILLTPNYPPESGACSARIAYIAKRLNEQGHHVHIVTALPNYPTSRIFEAYKNKFTLSENQNGIQIRRYWVFPSHSPSIWLRGLNMLSLAIMVLFSSAEIRRFRPDWILVQSPPLLLGLSGYFLSKISGAKFIFNVSDLYPQILKDLGKIRSVFWYRFFEKIEKFLYQNAQLCLAQCQEISSHIQKISPKTPVLLYRTGVDCEVFVPKKDFFSPKFRVIYAGMLGLAQGVLDLCQHVDFAKQDIEWHIYGEGFEKQKIADFLKKNNSKSIFLHPLLSQNQIAQLLPTFDAALVIQKNKILGTVPSKIYEAMACALPILHIGTGESAEIVLQNKAGLVSLPQDYADFEKNLQKLKNMTHSERQILGENGRKAALLFFDRAKEFDKLMAFFTNNNAYKTHQNTY